jgi:hypothetical protein
MILLGFQLKQENYSSKLKDDPNSIYIAFPTFKIPAEKTLSQRDAY